MLTAHCPQSNKYCNIHFRLQRRGFWASPYRNTLHRVHNNNPYTTYAYHRYTPGILKRARHTEYYRISSVEYCRATSARYHLLVEILPYSTLLYRIPRYPYPSADQIPCRVFKLPTTEAQLARLLHTLGSFGHLRSVYSSLSTPGYWTLPWGFGVRPLDGPDDINSEEYVTSKQSS